MTPYPNKYEIEEIFANRANPAIFNKHIADPVDAVVVGQDYHIGGHYKSMDAFHAGIYARVTDSLKVETIRLEVIRVIGGGDSPWAAVESVTTAEGIYGKPLHLEYCDLVRFNSEGKIAQIKEFVDSGHVHAHVEEHEQKTGKKKHPGVPHAKKQHTSPAAPAPDSKTLESSS